MSYSPARIEIWNLEEDVTFPCLGSQRIFNITGRIDYPITEIKNFYYVLNNYKSMPIPQGPDCGRLVNEGDFNIDTILVSELHPENTIDICLESLDGQFVKESRRFFVSHRSLPEAFNIHFSQITSLADVSQIVDGNWQLENSVAHGPCMRVKPEYAGWDRIILFGRPDIDNNFEVVAKLSVEQWVGNPHGVGIIFHWQDHKQGAGFRLPTEWNTSLAWYYTLSKGLQIKYGING